jgi:hypothetical protein
VGGLVVVAACAALDLFFFLEQSFQLRVDRHYLSLDDPRGLASGLLRRP